MLWKYFLFETKLMLHNRKNLFLGLVLLLFFPFFFMYYSDSEPETLESEKRVEQAMIEGTFNMFPPTQEDTPEGAEIYENYLQQSSLVNYQLYYLSHVGLDESSEDYIENGLQLNELRLQIHELDNHGIPDHLVISKEDILKNDAFLRYAKKNNIPLEPNPFVAISYLVVALSMLSGLFYFLFVFINGSEMLVYEQEHRTVMNGFPVAFMKKVHSKVIIHFLYIFLFLILGMAVGGYVAYDESGFGNLFYPVLIYLNGGYEAISIVQYYLYVFLAIALITIMLLYLSALLNMLFKNAYANVLIGFGLFFLPDLFMTMGVEPTWLYPIKYMDFSKVLSGELAAELGNSQIDYWHSIIRIAIMAVIIIGIIKLLTLNSFRAIKNDQPTELRNEDRHA